MAIEISSPAREVLETARAKYEPEAGEMPPHVTVLAPIDVDADAMPAVIRHLSSVASGTAPFRIDLKGVETFRPISPVVFVPLIAGAAECGALESRVRSGDMAVETRFPYHPHVTLAHDVADVLLDRAVADFADFEFGQDVERMGLYENVDGQWLLVQEFVFTG